MGHIRACLRCVLFLLFHLQTEHNIPVFPLHTRFRVIVVVSTMHAYTKLAPPLLNRFEKQCFYRGLLMDDVRKIDGRHIQ